jgi:hypothetical protein
MDFFINVLSTERSDWYINLLIIIGILAIAVGVAMSKIPFLKKFVQYRLPGVLLGAVMLLAGVYFKGEYNADLKWKLRFAELEKQLIAAQGEAKLATAKVEHIYIDRVRTVRDVQVVVQEKIRDVQVEIDSQCVITPVVVDIHNQSAANKMEVKK